ncbi:MAG: O-antigen ligase family protein [Verrucomicrobiota bacterium]
MLLVALVLPWRFGKDFYSGLSCSVALLVSLPKHIQIAFGGLPALTIHRLIVVVVLFYWLKERRNRSTWPKVPFSKLLWCILLTQGVSMLCAEDFISSVKEFLYYALENLLYFALLATILRGQEDAVRLVRGMCVGLLGVAVLAFIEKYRGYSPMQYFPGYYEGTVMATFSHRILLGTAMAMGWPLCMLWAKTATSSNQRRVAWLAAVLCIGACYFAQSRGPWIGMVLVGIVLVVLGSGKQRKRLIFLGLLAMAVCMTNRGVRETIVNRTGSTYDEGSEAQVSYQWRWELWHKAWSEISKSPVRLLLGYGPGASESLNWEGEVVTMPEFATDTFSSWDNNWAAYLLECGLLGLSVLLCFYGVLSYHLLRICWRAEGSQRDYGALIFATLMVFIFMQTNVQIFAPQLYFLFWTTLAVGLALGRIPASDHVEENLHDSELTLVCAAP